MCEWNVTGAVRPCRDADTDEPCRHGIQRIGFRIDSNGPGKCCLGNPSVQLRLGLDAVIDVAVKHLRNGRGDLFGGRALCLRPDHCHGVTVRAGGGAVELLQQRPKAVMLQKGAQGGVGNFLQEEIVQRLRQGRIILQRDKNARQAGLVRMFDQIVAHLGRFHRGRGFQHGFQIAKFKDQLGRCLGADARNTGHIVCRIPHQSEDIGQTFRSDAEFVDHSLRAEPLTLHWVEHVEARLDELHQILIGRHNGDEPVIGECGLGVGRNNVIRFQPKFFNAGQRERARGIADHGELRNKVFRRGRSVCLILIVNLVAERL